MCIFNAVKKQSGIGFIVDALFGYLAYLHCLYTVVELHTNFILIHFGRQPLSEQVPFAYPPCTSSNFIIQFLVHADRLMNSMKLILILAGMYINTYVIAHYKPSVIIIDLVSHTPAAGM